MHDVSVFTYDKHFDERGQLYTNWKLEDYDIRFVQDKVSVSKYGTIRGFHGDWKTWKLISCLHGRFRLITFNLGSRKKHTFDLDYRDNFCKTVLVPPGTVNAHQCLSDECVLLYKWSHPYDLDKQISIHYNDPMIKPEWINTPEIIVSKRDVDAQTYEEFLDEENKCICYM